MLTFTASGAVQAPAVVQIRVTRSFPGRVEAGAPTPPRTLTDDEVLANVQHFTEGMRGPRTRACTSLVLSGADLEHRPGLADVIQQGRTWGLERVTVHVGHGDPGGLLGASFRGLVDAAAITVRGEGDLTALERLDGFHRTAVVLLDAGTLPQVEALAAGLASVRPERVVFTWPFPPGQPPPPAQVAVAAVTPAISLLDAAGITAGVKGLPACALGALRDRLWRSGNRWYVDAQHQAADALLFFPDVVRFGKVDDCRFCSFDGRCDGAPEAWLKLGIAGRILPID